jgi:hypothetical protein
MIGRRPKAHKTVVVQFEFISSFQAERAAARALNGPSREMTMPTPPDKPTRRRQHWEALLLLAAIISLVACVITAGVRYLGSLATEPTVAPQPAAPTIKVQRPTPERRRQAIAYAQGIVRMHSTGTFPPSDDPSYKAKTPPGDDGWYTVSGRMYEDSSDFSVRFRVKDGAVDEVQRISLGERY